MSTSICRGSWGRRARFSSLFAGAGLVSWFGLAGSGSPGDGNIPHFPGDAESRETDARPTVLTVAPEVTTLSIRFDQPGIVEPYTQADLYAKVAGYVKSVTVDIGETVTAGQVLMEIDVPELAQEIRYKAALEEQARNEHRKAETQISAAEAAIDQHEAVVEQARADIPRAEAAARHAEVELDRFRQLVNERAVTGQVVQEKELQLAALQAALASARARLQAEIAARSVLRARIDEARAEQTICAARIRVAQADREKTEVLAEYAQVKAPFDGAITARNFDVGAYIRGPGSDRSAPIFTIVRTDRVRVTFQVPEREVADIRAGAEGSVCFDGLTGAEHTGTVARLSRSLEERSRTMRVEMDLENAQGLIYPGMYGRASIVLREIAGALTVPASSIETTAAGAFVHVVDADNVARRIPVTTGVDDGRVVQITSGLSGSERIIVGSKGDVVDGRKVAVQDALSRGQIAGL